VIAPAWECDGRIFFKNVGLLDITSLVGVVGVDELVLSLIVWVLQKKCVLQPFI